MPFPKKLLNSYETVRLDLHPHWWYLTPPAAGLLGSIVLVVIALVRPDGKASGAEKAFRVLALALLIICVIWLLARYLKWLTTNFVITSDRLIFRQGFLRKEGIQIPLERVNNVNFSQSLFERIIGAGDLVIESAGRDGQERFSDIKHPDRVTNLIHEAMEGNEGRRATGGAFAPPVASADAVTQIEKLEGLLQRGSITPEEFEAQKRKLLG